jgi:signal transduction histidine kinase
MLAEVFLGAVIVVVSVLVALDGYRIKGEGAYGHGDASAHDARPAMIGASRGGRAEAFLKKPAETGAGTGGPAPAAAVGPARRPANASPAADGRQPGRTGPSAVGQRSRRELRNWRVGSRLLLLVGIPTVAVSVVAFCVVRVVGALRGTAIHSPAGSVRDQAVTSAIAFGVVAIIALALAVWSGLATARSVLRPLDRLRAGAVELPDAVRRISEGNGQGRPSDVKPIGVESSDEIGQIARAFDQMRAEFLRQAANEAALRARLNAMFLNLSHRSQSLAERQVRLIDQLEQGEQDAGHRANLFKLDRITARMHRGSQNLLILAGNELTSSWNQPVALADLVRAAVSEIEDGERASLNAQPDIAVRGPVVNDLVHLLAELAENATSFSAADMPVDISGQLLATGGVLVDITDRGIGMDAKDMAYANWQLENLPAADINVPRWMGLFVVARLAARHGIRVRLHAAEFGGLKALVWLPDEILTARSATASLRPSGSTSAGSTAGFPEPAGQQGALAGRRPASGADERSGPEWPAGGQRPAFQPEPAAAAGPSGHWRPDAAGQTEAAQLGGTAPRNQATGPADRGVVLPPAEGPAETIRLPIYDEVESRWFGGGHQAPGSPDRTAVGGSRWSSSADAGWHAAEAVDAPTVGGTTQAGLPKRLPNANLVPGAIPGPPPDAPTRSADVARDRLTGFRRGVSEGRAAAGRPANPGGDDQS